MKILVPTRSTISAGTAEASAAPARFIGIDVGAETVKLVELIREDEKLRLGRYEILEHGKKPGPVLIEALQRWGWARASGASISGRFSSQARLPRIPTKQAQIRGYRFLLGSDPGTIVSIGSHGFSVLELRPNDLAVFRENSRCSQGTGNFLRQLVERFSLTVEEASRLCADVANPARLSGRCPVILKTDMTHLANKGEDRARILAGLFDAVCENVLTLLKAGASPKRVLLTGGVSRSPRVRRVLKEALAQRGLELMPDGGEQWLCLEALGCAVVAAESPIELPPLGDLLLPPVELKVERLPPLTEALNRVRRMPARPLAQVNGELRSVVLGFDIGSTGAKLVALDAASSDILWEGYRQTLGDPVGAAQELLRRFTVGPAAACPIIVFGATGSGREVVGSLLASCYGKEAVFIVNEIVAHATGAIHYDPRVDTIFEIGGQDAKYIRLTEGRVTDCAMNEACSAGTGSFIEEQGRKFAGIEDVRQLGLAALGAKTGISLGQHCSVFMAEVIDEGVAAGLEPAALISGLYDSIIKNYLNRVKGNRSVGTVIFCQGMPFSADALAAAVARQTGSEVIVPPNPGTVGALGIALLAARELLAGVRPSTALDPQRFLGARVEQKDTFVCGSTTGCGGAGNHCRIERLCTVVNQERARFTWGGGCALHDKGTRKKKLPNLAPDPFREHAELLERLLAPFAVSRGRPRVALSDELMLKGLFPFFAAFLYEAGLDLEIVTGADQAVLKRGIESANVLFCAPMQLFNGLADRMALTGADWLFVPMVRSLPRVDGQRSSVVCPIVQASPDLVRCTLQGGVRPGSGAASSPDSAGHETPPRGPNHASPGVNGAATPKLLSPQIEFGAGGIESREFRRSCRALARELGLTRGQWQAAWHRGVAMQNTFDAAALQLGVRALEFCRERNLTPVVVLGRAYTIHNRILNSNVPAILREQGAIAIPADCYPIDPAIPQFPDMYWGYGQHLLRAAHQVRRSPGVYALYCSNYSCGPDSFNLHFAAHIMEGKPFVTIETDGHSGDAGTKTRVEAFLHCVDEDRRVPHRAPANNFTDVQTSDIRLAQIGRNNGSTEKLLIPCLGPASSVVGAVFRGLGLSAESLPPPDNEALRLGRRYTSGKECLPMPLTLGSLLQRLARAQPGERFVYLMPSTDGPCRFGVYNLLNRIVLQRCGWQGRLRIWSPKDTGYFDDLPGGTEVLLLAGIHVSDLLLQAQLDIRPLERVHGQADALYQEYFQELLQRLERAAGAGLRLGPALWEVATGRLFGLTDLLERAGARFAALRGPGEMPVVELTGEIYVRAVDFSNDFVIKQLEARGLRVRIAPQSEWLAYCSYVRRQLPERNRFADRISDRIQHRIDYATRKAIAPQMGWPALPSITESLTAAGPYVSAALEGEAVLTVGAALENWRRRQIDAVLSVGPLECMPTKIAEAQFHHLTEHEGLLSLTLAFNGDPINTAALDNFAFEVNARFRRHQNGRLRTPPGIVRVS